MSLIDLASLVLAPTATKEGKVYSAIPDTGDGDMTFTRGSAATRVNSAGLIEKERANLLLQSNAFDTTWTNVNTSETGGQTGYDGSSDAWLLSKTSSSAYITQSVSNSNVQTFSVYAKEGDSDWIGLILIGGSNPRVYFDLSNGTSGELSGGAIGKDIQSVGNGWYRCSVTCNDNISSVRLYPAEGEGVVTGTTGNIYIQDAMLNEGLVAQSYIETTTTAVYEGITDDVPRVDYSGGGCPSLLLEGQRTNLFEYSEYFEGSYWGKTQQGSASVPVVTGNYAISPEGVQNATRVQFDAVGSTSSDRSGLVRDFAFTSGTTYSISCWVKATSGNNELVQFRVAGAQVGGEQTATDEWQLFTATHTATVSTTDNFGMQVRGNNTTNESDILIYGMQLEQASYPTSYIPTYGGSSVTRSEDSCSKTGISSLIGQTEGVVFVEFDQNLIGQSATRRIFALNDGTTSNRITAYISSTNKIDFYVRNSGGDLFFGNSTLPIGNEKGVHKIACAYKDEDYAVYMDGDLIISGTGTAGTIPACSRFDLGQQIGANDLYEPINQALLFKTRLTNDELAELTTL
jgi:hypothetical protein